MATILTLPTPAARHPGGGHPADAVRKLRQAARIARESGRLVRARRLYRELVAALGDDGDALHWLGVLEQELGQPAAARACLARAVALDPASAQRRYHLAEVLRAADRPDEALEHYDVACRLAPEIADAWFGRGRCLLALERIEGAIESLEWARALAPRDAAIAATLREACAAAAFAAGEGLRRRGQWREAADCYGRTLELDPDHAPALVNLGTCRERLGDPAAARELYARAGVADPELAEARLNLGIQHAIEGDRGRARAELEAAVALEPRLGIAHYHLALLDDGVRDVEVVSMLERLLVTTELDQAQAAEIRFALARRLDRLGEHDRAFGHLREANRLRRAMAPFDRAAHQRLVDGLIHTLDRSFFRARAGFGVTSERPLLVVGMPRSGTTLVEQILAAHPAVHGAGEREDLRDLCRAVAPPAVDGTLARAIAAIAPDAARDLGTAYVERLAATAPDALRIVDKLPGNYLRLGLLALIAPNARVIWCRRDPLDTCLSCYFQSFADGQAFAYDLEALGVVYRLHEQLMRHWRAVLPNPILEVRYEDLVAEPEAETRRLVAFAGLDWQPNCLAFSAERRPIRTSSLWQAREPVHRRSVGRWRHYARHLEPLCR